MSIAERLKILRSHLDLKQKEFANLLGISFRTLQTYEQEKTSPNFNVIDKIRLKFNVSSKWLLEGEGPIFNEEIKLEKDTGTPLVPASPSIYKTTDGGFQAGTDPVTPYSPEELVVGEALRQAGFAESDFSEAQQFILIDLARSKISKVIYELKDHIVKLHAENKAKK